MNEFKEFSGRTLDEAIEEACAFFGGGREKLEIEIVSGGSSGIFGLVGVKKAAVRARPRANPTELKDLVKGVVEQLISAIVGQAKVEVNVGEDRVNVFIEDEEDSGLLIGREGQTLAALQYLANRIVARRWAGPVRVQIDTGEYREKQDDNLRKMALYLADKARQTGRPQSTKPLSSYHRRVVHLALQEDETVQTRSKGEGPLKRVIVLPRKQDGAFDEEAVHAGVPEECRAEPSAETRD
jgi:spoIIIJ-associated protein